MAGFEVSSRGKRISKPPAKKLQRNQTIQIGKDLAVFVSPTEPLALKAIGQVSLLPEDHGVDILDLGSRTGIQRKTLNDLYASMHDGRLAKQIGQRQDNELVHNYVLLLEGSSFGLDVPLTEQQLSMTLLTIQRCGYYIMQSKNLTHTCQLVPQIFFHFRNEHHNLVNRPPTIKSNWQLTFLQLLPGVGNIKAQRILDELGFPFELRDREKLLKIVGPSTYGKITKYLGMGD